jgi:hypothetical protein
MAGLTGLALLAVASAVSPAMQAAQGSLVRGDASATVFGDGAPARVALRYVLRPGAGATEIPLTVLLFGTALTDVQARVDGAAAALELRPVDSRVRLRGVLALPGGSNADSVVIELLYGVTGAAARGDRIRLPILAVTWPPAGARPGTFRGRVEVSAGLIAYNAFPSVLRALPSSDSSPTYGFDLPVVPAVLAFDLKSGDRPMITLATVLNAGVLLMLVVFGWTGWRRFHVEA